MPSPVVNEIRNGERTVPWSGDSDAGLVFIGRIHTPWLTTADCPRQGRRDGPLCRIDIFEPWGEALRGIETCPQLEVFYWLHLSRRDLVLQCPRNDGNPRGTFSIRSPLRPNPIGASIVALDRVEAGSLYVRGLDCLDGTPVIDIKPDLAFFKPLAPEKAADRQVDPTLGG